MFCRFSRCNNSPAIVCIRPTYGNKYSPTHLVERNLIYLYALTLRNLNHVIIPKRPNVSKLLRNILTTTY